MIPIAGASQPLARTLILIICSALGVSMVGCLSSEPSPEPKSDPTPTRVTVAVDIVQTSTGTESTASSGGGTLRIETYGFFIPDPVTDIDIDNDTFSPLMWGEMFSGLTRISDDPGSPVETDLAERYSVSDDGLLYEFVLRKNLKFSDGSPVAASDFKWSWERALNSPSGTLRATRVLGSIAGADAVSTGESQELAGVDAIDERTLHIRLNASRPEFPSLLADPMASVLKRDNVQKWGPKPLDWSSVILKSGNRNSVFELPVGTGPFKLTKFDAFDVEFVLERNDHYWKGPPEVDRIEFLPIFDGGTENEEEVQIVDYSHIEAAFDEGELDIIREAVEVVEWLQSGDIEISGNLQCFDTAPTIDFLAFNPALSPYDDQFFRRALAAAADVDTMLAAAYPESGFGKSSGILPPNTRNHGEKAKVIQYDLDLAASELNGSKYRDEADQLKLTYHNQGLGLSEIEFESLAASWGSALGVDTEYRFPGISEYSDLLNDGEIEMIYSRVQVDYPDPSAVLGVFEGLFGKGNAVGDLAEVEQMLDAASSERDAAVRLQLYSDLEQHILDSAIAIPIKWNLKGECVRVQPWVQGYHIPKYSGSRFKNVSIDTKHPEYSAGR